MINKFSLYLFGTIVLSFFTACKNEGSSSKDIATTADTVSTLKNDTIDKFSRFKYNMIISNIPFPFEMLEKLYTSGIPFHQNVMNPAENISMYSRYNSKAVNLGIYGADLAYAVTFEEFQQIGPYVKNTKKLAEDLNIPLAFNQEMMDKYTKFKDNKDSLAKVVYESYSEVDKTLKSNERIGMAGLVVTGSWLEGLYLSTKTFLEAPKNSENKEVYTIIWQQKSNLDNVIKLLEEFRQDDYFANILTELTDIKSVYSKLAVDTDLTEKELIVLNQKVEKLRNRISKGL